MPVSTPTPVSAHDDPCAIATRWRLDPVLAEKIVQLAAELEFGIMVISGGRSRAEQDALEAAGRPTAPFDLSTHALTHRSGCGRLSTGVDVWTAVAPVRAVQARLGAEATFLGLRWGGGSPVDPETGIPSDWNHLDLGPRTS